MRLKYLAVVFLILLGNKAVCAGNLDSNLRFSHKTHNQNSITCSRCHVDSEIIVPVNEQSLPPGWQPLKNNDILASTVPTLPSKGAREAGTFARPGEKLCLECHFKTKKGSDCALCHLDKPGITKRKRRRLNKYVIFEHSKHTSIACVACHPRVTNWENLNGNHVKTRMEFCLKCHTGKKPSNNCKVCHNPIPHPKDHIKNFEKKHGIAYRSNPQKCKMCHQESSCVQCHARKPRDHTLAWIKRNHAFDARTNPERCQACHSDKWVCKRCHTNWK